MATAGQPSSSHDTSLLAVLSPNRHSQSTYCMLDSFTCLICTNVFNPSNKPMEGGNAVAIPILEMWKLRLREVA